MRKRKVILLIVPLVVLLMCLPLLLVSCATVGIEKVQYAVLEKDRAEKRMPSAVAEIGPRYRTGH